MSFLDEELEKAKKSVEHQFSTKLNSTVYSVECAQDFSFIETFLAAVRTPEITDSEIADWKSVSNYLDSVDLDKTRKELKVEFISDEYLPPYSSPEDYDNYYHKDYRSTECSVEGTNKVIF